MVASKAEDPERKTLSWGWSQGVKKATKNEAAGVCGSVAELHGSAFLAYTRLRVYTQHCIHWGFGAEETAHWIMDLL